MRLGKFDFFSISLGNSYICMLNEYTHHITHKKVSKFCVIITKIKLPPFIVLTILKPLKSTEDWQISPNELQSI